MGRVLPVIHKIRTDLQTVFLLLSLMKWSNSTRRHWSCKMEEMQFWGGSAGPTRVTQIIWHGSYFRVDATLSLFSKQHRWNVQLKGIVQIFYQGCVFASSEQNHTEVNRDSGSSQTTCSRALLLHLFVNGRANSPVVKTTPFYTVTNNSVGLWAPLAAAATVVCTVLLGWLPAWLPSTRIRTV